MWKQTGTKKEGIDPDVECWEIVSNFNCNLKSQLGFLVEGGKINLSFLVVDGKTISWCVGGKFIHC